jgi:F0F1-type ATP synthase epsilon subunit
MIIEINNFKDSAETIRLKTSKGTLCILKNHMPISGDCILLNYEKNKKKVSINQEGIFIFQNNYFKFKKND